MMRLIKIIVTLSILGAIGYGVWLYFFTEKDVPEIFGPRFPKESLYLESPIELETYKETWLLSASTRGDLFFAQGLCHGKEAGKKLIALRDLFKGEASSHLPKDLKDLAGLFYYIDLEHVAKKSAALYNAGTYSILEQYAKGLTEGSSVGWTVEDVLLMQRGYAFLLGHNFVKEWSANRLLHAFGDRAYRNISDYPITGLGGIGPQVKLHHAAKSLFGPPLLEMTRSSSGPTLLALQTRSHPWLSFVFMVTTLTLEDQLEASGLSLVGTPFLWSGSTKKLVFVTQPIAADDEQFSQTPTTAFVGRDKALFRNEAATRVKDYPSAPTHARYGRWINPLVSGVPGMEYFYDWDGLRPSADLTALHLLLEVDNVDEALSAWQHAQVPAVELTLLKKNGRKVNIQITPSKPGQTDNRWSPSHRLFKRPYFQIGAPLHPVRGMDFFVDQPIGGLDPNKKGHSLLDRQLASLATYYINGPMAGGVVNPEHLEDIDELLNGPPSSERDYLLMLIWDELLEAITQHYLEETEDEFVAYSSYPQLKRFLLMSLGRGEGSGTWNQGPLKTRVLLMEKALTRAWRLWRLAASAQPAFPYQLENSEGEWKEVQTGSGPRSQDAMPGTFWVNEQNHIKSVASYTLIWAGDFHVRVYEHVISGSIGPSQDVKPENGKGRVFKVRPKI